MLYKKYIINGIIIILMTTELFGFLIHTTPMCEVFTPRSLHENIDQITFIVGNRKRVSTCSGVAWFHDNNYLATVNFEGGFICTYRFNKDNNQFIPLQIIHDSNDAKLVGADNIAVSDDGILLAVSINRSQQVNVYSINTETHLIDPVPAAIVKHKDPAVHGVRFSHDNNYVACTTIRGDNSVTIYKLEKDKENKKVSLALVSNLKNRFKILKPKSLDFTQDDNYVAIVYAANVTTVKNLVTGLVAIHKFDKNTGIIDEKSISIYRNNREFVGGEDINFSPDDSCIFISEHARDRILVHEFDKIHGKIGKRIAELKNPEARLSFPHGIKISSDGKYLAVANYGDDKCSIYGVDFLSQLPSQ